MNRLVVRKVPPSERTELFLPAPSVTFAVATGAKRYQVAHHIVTELAALRS